MKRTSTYTSVLEALGFERQRHNDPLRSKALRTAHTALACSYLGDEDRNYETFLSFQNRTKLDEERRKAEEERRQLKEEMAKMSKKEKLKILEKKKEEKRKNRTRKIVVPKKAKVPVLGPLVDVMVLIEEVDTGRYPSITRYQGKHKDYCCFCQEGGALYHCTVCRNSEHLECLTLKQDVHDPTPEDEFLCHVCIGKILCRRKRAEKRRMEKRVEVMGKAGVDGNDPEMMLTFPEGAPEMVVHDKSEEKQSATGTTGKQKVSEVKRVALSTSMSRDQKERMSGPADKNAVQVTRSKELACVQYGEKPGNMPHIQQCPVGGPGGLICCSACTASFSRMLTETAQEMEAQMIANCLVA
uniref:PHD-type domain-containing protein n=1 Tax=Trieres chinensis TaxID=1514140 RepID=A0A7S1Z0C0_TRICV|mmetsp:Transcript_14482/g.29775  ORF Transcript_14482/g.29775 Transcript_14482/m.29775 type:complete len:356 (+) Transcript_14482:2-1069(+)